MRSHFPAKVLLFGEYTLLFGSKGVVIPFPRFSGEWSFGKGSHQSFEQSQALFKFIKSLKEQNSTSTRPFQHFDLNAFSQDLLEGIYFESSIPQGIGMGSSGALCAALWDRYYQAEELPLSEVRSCLALIEAFYHHSSSGLDPLVSLVQRPLLLHGPDNIEFLDSAGNLGSFYLLPTGVSRKTAPLVQLFKNKLQDEGFKKHISESFVPLADRCATACLEESDQLGELMLQLSEQQLEVLPEYFTKEIRTLAIEGLRQRQFAVKLCGAGAGGVYLLYVINGHSEEIVECIQTILPRAESCPLIHLG